MRIFNHIQWGRWDSVKLAKAQMVLVAAIQIIGANVFPLPFGLCFHFLCLAMMGCATAQYLKARGHRKKEGERANKEGLHKALSCFNC